MATAVAAAVIAASGSGATFAAGTAAAAALTVGGALVDMALTTAYQKKKASDLKDFKPQQDVTLRSAIAPRNIVYGKTRVSGPLIYGNQQAVTGTDDNSEMYQAVVMAGHEVEEIQDVWLDGDEITNAQIDWGTNTVTGGKYSTPAGKVNFYRYHGSDAQAASSPLVTEFTDWTTSHQLKGIAYLVTRFELGSKSSQSLWESGAPTNIRCVVKGKKVYDPRKDDTMTGGTGTHRVTDSTTWEWSDNPALCLADYIIDARVGMGAEGMTYTDIDYSYVMDAADHCDALVDIPGSTTQKRYTCNGVIYTSQTYADNISDLLSAMNGTIIRTGGKFIIRAGEYEAPSTGFDFTGDDVVGPVQVQPQRSRTERFNTVRGQFVDPDQNYAATEFLRVQDSDYVTTRDDGQEIISNMALPMTQDEYTAQRLAWKQLQLNNQQLRATVPMNFKALKVAPGDRITLTIDELSWSSKIFRVESWKFDPEKGFVLGLREDASTAYDDPAVGDYGTRSAAGVISFGQSQVPSASGLTATSTENGVLLEWEAPRPSSNYDEVVLYASPDSSWANAVEIGRQRGTTFFQKLNSGTQRYYWTQSESSDGRTSVRDPDSDTSSITATAGDLDFAYVGGATRPEDGADVTADHAVNNGVDNPSFGAGDTSWSTANDASIVQDGTNARSGSFVGKITNTSNTLSQFASLTRLPVDPGDKLLARMFAKRTDGTGSIRLRVHWRDGSGTLLSSSVIGDITASPYAAVRGNAVAPAGAETANLNILPQNPSGLTGYVDDTFLAIVSRDSDTDALGTTNGPAEPDSDKTGNHSADVDALITQNGPVEGSATQGLIDLSTANTDAGITISDPTTWTTVQSDSFSISSSETVMLTVFCTIEESVEARVLVNGTEVGNLSGKFYGLNSVDSVSSFIFRREITFSSGSHSVNLQMRKAGSTDAIVRNRNISIEFVRAP